MKKALIFLPIFLGFIQICFGQQSLQKIWRKSHQAFLYKISADSAEKYLEEGIGDVDHLLKQQPLMQFAIDRINHDTIPIGNYLIISVQDFMINAQYYCSSKILPYVINNQVRPQIFLRDKEGNTFTNAKLWVDKKAASLNALSGSFIVENKNPDESIVKIVVGPDTSFGEISVSEENYISISKQRAARLRSNKIGKIITWVPDRIKYLVTNKPKNWVRKKYKTNVAGKGYVLFNKSKYFPSDTIKLKAYLLNRKGKQYKSIVKIHLAYSSKNGNVDRLLTTLKPATAGAYVYEFATGDTLPNDTRYTLRFLDKKNRLIYRGNFKIEDYLLDEVATYDIKSLQKKYFTGDTLQFNASAKDANGLALMDGMVKLILLRGNIKDYYQEQVFVPDTLWQQEQKLAVEGDTKFFIPTDSFPDADIMLQAVAIFKNSNNEIQEKTAEAEYYASNAKIDVKVENGMLSAIYYHKGKAANAKGFMKNDLTDDPVAIQFPYTAKIDPQVEEYDFYIEDENGNDITYAVFNVEAAYRVAFSRTQRMDTSGFELYNPNKVPVYYSIYDKDKVIFASSSSEENITWRQKMPVGKIYYLRWQYYWAGEERTDNENIALLSKLMSAEIGGSSTVYPGQVDTITVKLKDYKQNKVQGVNITAVSYNSQFAKDINVPEPPYIEKFHGKRPLMHDEFEIDDISVSKNFSLGKHQQWRKVFGLDTMPYYTFLFPDSNMQMVKTRIAQLLPQVAVYAVQNGVPQEIYMLYINRELVYYNGVTDKGLNAASLFPGYAQVGMRLKDKYIGVDSIYLQPYYKHDIVFDIDKQGKDFKVKEADIFWSSQEKLILNNRILRIENNSRNNNGYVWQDDKAYYLGNSGEHVVGPFINLDSIQFYKPGDFDFKFSFEPGYRYRITPKMVRLEKIPLVSFEKKVYLPTKKTTWELGDTLTALPKISYEKKITATAFLEQQGNNFYQNNYNSGRIQIQMPKDSVIAFTVLYNKENPALSRVLWGSVNILYNIPFGNYSLILVTKNLAYLMMESITVSSTGTYCIKFHKPKYTVKNEMVATIIQQQLQRKIISAAEIEKRHQQEEIKKDLYKVPQMMMPAGSGMISGRVVDAKGNDPIAGASVSIKGYRTGTSTLANGSFQFTNLAAGKYVLVFASVGYAVYEREVIVTDEGTVRVDAALQISNAALQEVIVTGYGVTRQRKELGFSTSSVKSKELTSALTDKVAGMYVQYDGNGVFDSTRIMLRGIRSISGNSQPLMIINGVVGKANALSELHPDDIASVTILKSAEATALYGADGANGAILITTKGFGPKMLREEFRDYAFWKPNLISNDEGEVKFAVTYPDNITSWQTYVVGMDKKHRITKASQLVKAFKPMLAQLSTPQFLVEGDSAIVIGKKVNYTSSALNVSTEFSVNGKIDFTSSEILKANDAAISDLKIIPLKGADTVIAKFTMKADNGFADGELRKIPVLRKGTIETIGQFNILENDTTINFQLHKDAGEVKVFAQNNTFDLLLEEIEHLKKYPYYCMEQTASKLTGLAMESKIRDALKQPFNSEKEMRKLLEKLQKAQLFDGGWGWWDGSRQNIYITNYVTRSLLQLRGDVLLESNIRNALLFLQNQLPGMDKYELLESLYTLNESEHDMDYNVFLQRLIFDSLTQHQQWQVVSILQKQKLNYDKELQFLMSKKTNTMLGGLHWGENNYWWNRNEVATTVLAYKTLGRATGYQKEQKQVIQYFLEKRKTGHWQNTVESATILSSILPDVIKNNSNFTSPASLQISGDTTVAVSTFPLAINFKPSGGKLKVSKQGGGMVYFTCYQQLFNNTPSVVDSNFRIQTYFVNGRETIKILKAGEKVKMKVEVTALKDANYVQLEIPIPAGCTYGAKNSGGWNEYREYFKDRVIIFIEKMNKGFHTYEIELEPRYSGSYTINPAKAELMYFPVFYGRNELKKIEIVK